MNDYTEAFALIGGTVDVHLGANDVTERHKHLCQFGVSELLRQVIDEQIAALRSFSDQFGPHTDKQTSQT